jgi:hypothetical protein
MYDEHHHRLGRAAAPDGHQVSGHGAQPPDGVRQVSGMAELGIVEGMSQILDDRDSSMTR